MIQIRPRRTIHPLERTVFLVYVRHQPRPEPVLSGCSYSEIPCITVRGRVCFMADPICRIVDAGGTVTGTPSDQKSSAKYDVAKVCVDPGTLKVVSAGKVTLSAAETTFSVPGSTQTR